MEFRIEKDALGEVKVPINAYYGPQTARSLEFFAVGWEKMPDEIIQSITIIKKACARANFELGHLPSHFCEAISKVADEILEGKLNEHFPLKVWQTGSGTQTNMNVNEVIATRANELLGFPNSTKYPIHPNDHVNMSQSSNDVFPTAMNIATVIKIKKQLLPALENLRSVLEQKTIEFKNVIKIGRTHLMDAVPITLGQEFSAYLHQIELGIERISTSLVNLYQLPIGGTAVGTGLNAPIGFDKVTVRYINMFTGEQFQPAKNKFEGLASHDGIVMLSGALKTLACSLMKLANDIRLMGSGPRCGLAELILPENEPGSSIMPGKVNPTQCEMMTMVCAQVIGNDTTISIAGASGQLELNVFKPVIAYNILQSIQLLSDACISFANNCIKGIKVNYEKIKYYLENSLMLITALSKRIGYENASKIARNAYLNNTTLKEEAIKSGLVTPEEFDEIVDPKKMLNLDESL